ncbi:MAG: hypothetical protein JO352_05015 [Chloroflexi bacterium]|nr:hypothetical protein [Chloroflexota bacterium]MBV9595877.1 hypothetical protein [Chloroflexota bacterium]
MRSTLTIVLTVLACLAVVLATIDLGVQQTLLNTDRWVAVVGPLASDPSVQSSVAQATAAVAVNAVDDRTRSLPGPLRNLAAPVESALSTFVDTQTQQIVASPQFAQFWVAANRAIHQGLVQFLRGGDLPTDGAVKVNDGQVEVNLLMLTPSLQQRMQQGVPALIASQLPADFGYVSIGQVDTLATLQRAVHGLDSITLLLVVAAPVLVVVALVVSPFRRNTTLWLGIGVALGMLIAGAALFLGESALAGSLANQPIGGAVQAALAATLVSIGIGMLVVFVAALAVALVAGLTGRGRVTSAT